MKYLLIPLLALCACTTTTTASVNQSFNQSVQIAASVNDAVIVTANTLLTSATITSAQAKKVLAITDNVNALLTAANAAWTAGNTALANSDLSIANTSAAATQTCLNATATLNACLAPIPGATP
jgi:hypothetical protein